MRVLHVIPGLAPSSGPTQAVLQLAREQSCLGADVTVAYITGRGADHVSINLNGPVEIIGFPARFFRRWGYSPVLRHWLYSSGPRWDQLHIHSMWLYPNVAASEWCLKFGVPYWVRPAGSLEPWSISKRAWRKKLYYHCQEKAVLEQSSAIHAVSSKEANNIARLGMPTPIVTISNGVDLPPESQLAPRDTARAELGLPQLNPVVLFLSRIHPVKGLDTLGHAFAKVLLRHPRALLAIVGPEDSGYASEVRSLYQRLGITTSVRFLGELGGHNKLLAYRAADVFVLPSQSENFGIVVAESLAAGTPVVTSRNTPWEDLREKMCGFWETLDADTFAMRISELLSCAKLRAEMSQRGRALVASKYSWPAIAQEVLKQYVVTGEEWKSRARRWD